MMRYFLDWVFHRIPWNGDTIRLYNREWNAVTKSEEIKYYGEYEIKIEDDTVTACGNNRNHTIRRDLPKWNAKGYWEYTYYPGSGS